MRILYAGNGGFKHRGARYYDVGRKLMRGLIRLGHDVYLFSDRDIARESAPLGIRKIGEQRCNYIFIETCIHFAPEMILLGHADIITPETLQQIRVKLPHVRIAQFNVDPIFREHNIAQIRSKLEVVDATFITTAGPALSEFHHPRGRVCYIPNPVDAAVEWPRAHEQTDQPTDVFWAVRATNGSFDGDPRIEFPLYLERNGVRISYFGMNGKPELFDARYFEEISRARMGLCINTVAAWNGTPRASDAQLYLYSSDRIAHYMGSGLMLLAMRDNKLEDLFREDEEIVLFSTKEEMLEKVKYYAANEALRQRIARGGWEKSHTHLNAQLVANFILDITFGRPLSHTYLWPTEHY